MSCVSDLNYRKEGISIQQFFGYDSRVPLEQIAINIPNDVISAIKSTPKIADIFNVSADELFDNQILKADEIVFSSRCHLTLKGLDSRKYPWVAIVAKKWKFAAPEIRTLISSDKNLIASRGVDGRPGDPGDGYQGDGDNGHPGGPGGPGGTGETIQFGTLYLIGGEILNQVTAQPIDWAYLTILIPGLLGGDGGKGGAGGRGQNGRQGEHAHDDGLFCRSGPQKGGDGGPGGPGGPGGSGGRGGNGGNVVYGGPQSTFLDTITFANVINVGGEGGRGLRGGAGGPGGDGGPPGDLTRVCREGRPGGSPGGWGPNGLPDGKDGTQGEKGSTNISIISDINSLF